MTKEHGRAPGRDAQEIRPSTHAHLTGRGHNKLNDGKARSALAAALLRQLFAVTTQRVPWDPVIASGAALPRQVTATAA